MTQLENDNDLLHLAVDCLRKAPVPPGPPEETLQLIRQADDANKSSKVGTFRYRRYVSRTVAAALVIALGAAAFFWVSGRQGIAYADVREKILNARSLVYRAAVTKHGQKSKEFQVSVLEGGHLRMTSKDLFQGAMTIIVADFSKGKFLIWTSNPKPAVLVSMKGGNKAMFCEDWLENLKKSLGDWAEDLGRRTIGDQPAKGFRTKKGDCVVTVWVHEKTGELIRAENTYPDQTVVMTDFKSDPVLAPSLFELRAPDGYKVTEETYDAYEELTNNLTKSAESAIGGLGKDLAKQMVAELKKAHESPSGKEIDSLTACPLDKGFPGLVKFLADKDKDVQSYASVILVQYLAAFDRKKVVSHLDKALDSKDEAVLSNIITVIMAGKYTELVPKIRSAVLNNPSLSVALSGCGALHYLGDDEGLRLVAQKHSDERIRKAAISELESLIRVRKSATKPGG